MIIKNKKELLSHGLKEYRRVALEIIEHSLKAVDPYKVTKRLIQLNKMMLTIGNVSYNLKKIEKIYVLGAGKATFPISKALEDILENKITQGIIIVKRNQKGTLTKIKKIEAGHPIPDKDGLQGAHEIITLADTASKKDLVFAIITGGSSSLMPLPAKGISLDEKCKVNELLLKSGAIIQEINAVRKHISKIKGGRLARHIYPAQLINLTVSDVIGDWDMLDYITGNTVPDTSTFQDAINTLNKYSLWNKIPISVRKYLKNARPEMETPKMFEGLNSHTFMLATNNDACLAAKKKAEALGFNSMILSTMIEGESREVGIVHAGIARGIKTDNRPLKPPCVLISGGETTVTIKSKSGEGGPNQEFILGLATKIGGSKEIVGISIDTDGTDGPTDIAGGVADGLTVKRAKRKNLDIYESLRNHNVSPTLRVLRDAVYTGATGTNVMNLRVIIISK